MTDLSNWLETIGLSKYQTAFTDNEIDFEVLPELTEQDLRELGLPMGPRKKLLKAIAALNAKGNTSHSETTLSAPRTYTPQHLADKILSSRSVLEGERKQVTILFADIKGSTQLVQGIDPERAAMLMDPVLRAMVKAVHRYEGTVNRMQGDGLMAIFGAPIAHEDHALRACLAALDMQNTIKNNAAQTEQENFVIQTRVGLNSGEVMIRSIDNDLSMNYDAVGETVHLAARMEQIAPPDGIYLTADTLHLVEDMVIVNPQGQQVIKGISNPIEVFQLTNSNARTRWQASLARGLSPFVGRGSTLKQLADALQHSKQGNGQLVAMMGEAGMGKSRLLHEFIGSPAIKDWQVLAGSSVSYGKATEWLPVADLCKTYFNLNDSDDLATKVSKIRAQLVALDAGFVAHLPIFLTLMDMPVEDDALSALGAKQQRRKTLDTLQALFVRESQRQPLILIFEDLHWIDGETQALLDELIERLPVNRILLLTNYRPEYRHHWGDLSYYNYLPLEPLQQTNTATLLNTLLGAGAGLGELKQLLIKRSAGNPLFVEESVRSMLETGFITGEQGSYSKEGALEALTLPATVQAIIAERIDRLAPADKQILQTAAVIGSHLPLAVLQSVTEKTDDELQTALGILQSAEFLLLSQQLPELEYRFKHAHTHQVAYSGLLHDQRRHLHTQVANTTATLYPDRHHELAEKLAEHYELGEADHQAIIYYLLAATKSKSKYIYPSALTYAKKALMLAKKHTQQTESIEQQIKALALLGDITSLMGELDQANDYYEQGLILARAQHSDQIHSIANRRHRRRFAIRDGAKIAFYEHGDGDTTLLLVTPTAYQVAMFQPVVEVLCQQFHVVTIDPRGTGSSDPLPEHYTMQEYEEDIHAVIKIIKREQVIAVGMSSAGRQITRLYRSYPQLIDKLVFVGTPPARSYNPPELIPHWELLEQGDFSQFDGFINTFAAHLFSEPEARDFADEFIRSAYELPLEVWQNYSAPEPDDDIWPLLEDIKIPLLVLHGKIDRQVPLSYSLNLVKQVSGAQLHVFQDKGHLLLFTAAQEFCEVLSEFALS